MTTPNATVHDPVCHMDIEITSAAGRSDYEGKTYYFCAVGCKKDFDEDPAGILKIEEEYDHTQAMDHGTMAVEAGARERPWWRFWSR